MEAHGSPLAKLGHKVVGVMPDRVAEKLMTRAGKQGASPHGPGQRAPFEANVRRWVDDLLPLAGDDDPLGLDTFATHRLPLDQAPDAYAMFQDKHDGAVKVPFQP